MKTVKFKNPNYIGDPINAVRIFNEKEVDELMVADIDASVENREPDFDLIKKLAIECRMPFCYAGGVRTIEQADRIISLGVEKVALSSAVWQDPEDRFNYAPDNFLQLPQERLSIACAAATIAEMAVETTVEYTKQRGAFGKTVFDFQNTRFKLAECKTEATVSRAFVDQCITKHVRGELSPEEASMAKWWCTQKQCDVVDECLQLHGGYGYMWEYPIARMYADSRVQKIYGGTNEIMKELISRSL